MLSSRETLRFRDTNRLKVKRMGKDLHTNSNHKRVGMATLISDKIDF